MRGKFKLVGNGARFLSGLSATAVGCTLSVLFMYTLTAVVLLRRTLLRQNSLRSAMTASVPVISRKDVTYLRQDEASKIDEELFSKYGFKVEQLMELAGLACAKAVHAQYSKGKVLVLCGPGNNGGDGFVCARHLQQFGFDPVVVYPKPSKTDLMNALVKQCTGMGIPVQEVLPELNDFSLIIDAFFGFSFKPPVREPFGEMIEAVTKSGLFVFSIDIPSGWHVENGPPPEGPYIRPHGIISLTAPKLCVKDWTGPHFIGGRFVPKQLALEHKLLLPKYPSADQIVKLE